MRRFFERVAGVAMLLGVALAWAQPATARTREGDPEYEAMQNLQKEWQVGDFAPAPGERITRPADIPDVFGPGAVLSVGNIFMKITNFGFNGNYFQSLSSDPSGQWKGASGVEYLFYEYVAVGAVNPLATDPTAVRRVSSFTEWRPPTLEPVDRMYRSFDGAVNGVRFVDDDARAGDADPITGDPRIDEDFLDGRDNDGDGLVDEDFAAIGQQMYTCVMRDDTPQAINAAAAERHVPLGLEIQQTAWAYSIDGESDGFKDFNLIQYDIYNRSGHTLDSVVIGFRTDMDCGPVDKSGYWTDDYNLPFYPHGDFIIKTPASDLRLQPANDRGTVPSISDVSADSALCPRYKIRVQGWSCVDDDGDLTKTPGIATFLLVDHTIDPTGQNGPQKVGIRAFRSFPGGTPYAQNGAPTIDQQRYEFMTSHDHIDPVTGFINQETGENKGDYSDWVSIGPWLHLEAGGHLQATIAFVVANGTKGLADGYLNDYARAVNPAVGAVTEGGALRAKYPTLDQALKVQIAFEGTYDKTSWPWLTDGHGRETPVRAPKGQVIYLQGCSAHDPELRPVNDRQYSWFDFDCDYCTGAFSSGAGGVPAGGHFHRTWVAASPPPSPSTNTSASYNFSDNPDRRFPPAGNGQVTVAWDNLSETTPDPSSHVFDFRGYKVWKVSDWQRPVGASGPQEKDWTLLADYGLFDSLATNSNPCPPESVGPGKPCTAVGDTIWPVFFIPQTNSYQTIKLYKGDLWNRQSGQVLRPDWSVRCQGWPNCDSTLGYERGQTSGEMHASRIKYPVGRWNIVDKQVKNGFVYFYSVTAYDATGFESRTGAVEADGIVPQAGVDTVGNGSKVWVVPNPYRGGPIRSRPSSWDLIPNASDPTGTHVDFFGLPRGDWHIKIFTVSGDLVAELGARDAVNESIRPSVTDAGGTTRPGYNRQADNPNDGQARWNLISRNGQDVVSGIYIFTVELGGTVKHRGKFVIIR